MTDRNWICPVRPRRKLPISRPSQTESGYVQTIVQSKLFMRSSCVRTQICPDYPRSKRYMSRLSCVLDQNIVRSKPNRAFNAKILVRPCPDHRSFISRLSRVRHTEKKLHHGVQCYSFKKKTEMVPNFHKSRYLKFIKEFVFKSLFRYD